jgi:vacuolar-type H+-ATPase subunit I/STV1
MEEKGMEGRNKGLVIFGIILLAMGLFASFYHVTRHIFVGDHPDGDETIYTLRNVGIVLIVAGIIFISLGFLYSPRHYQEQQPFLSRSMTS